MLGGEGLTGRGLQWKVRRGGGDHGKDQGGVGGAKHQAAQAASLPPRRAREDVGRDQGLGSGLLNESKQRRRARGGVRAALVFTRLCLYEVELLAEFEAELVSQG